MPSQSNAGSLVFDSVSISHYEARLVDSVGSLVVFSTPLEPTILSSLTSAKFPELCLMFCLGS